MYECFKTKILKFNECFELPGPLDKEPIFFSHLNFCHDNKNEYGLPMDSEIFSFSGFDVSFIESRMRRTGLTVFFANPEDSVFHVSRSVWFSISYEEAIVLSSNDEFMNINIHI